MTKKNMMKISDRLFDITNCGVKITFIPEKEDVIRIEFSVEDMLADYTVSKTLLNLSQVINSDEMLSKILKHLKAEVVRC